MIYRSLKGEALLFEIKIPFDSSQRFVAYFACAAELNDRTPLNLHGLTYRMAL